MDIATVIGELQKVLSDLQTLPDPASLQTQIDDLSAKVALLQSKIDSARAALA